MVGSAKQFADKINRFAIWGFTTIYFGEGGVPIHLFSWGV